MGTDREGERETMYPVLFLLIAPALGRPSSAQPDDVDKLDDINKFNQQLGELMKNSRLLGKVSEDLKEAQQNVETMEKELKSLESTIQNLKKEENHFPEFNQALFWVNETRKDLSKLALRTVAEVDDLDKLLDKLDKTQQATKEGEELKELVVKTPGIPDHARILQQLARLNANSRALEAQELQRIIKKMKDMMIETKERLEEARDKYLSAHQAFDNLKTSVELKKEIVDETVEYLERKYQKDKEYTETVRYNCKWAALFTLGLCSLIHHFENEVPLENDRIKLEEIGESTAGFLGRVDTLNRDIDDAIKVITTEIELINIWAVSADVVSKNIDQYPQEHLEKFAVMRGIFKRGLVTLKHVAVIFIEETKITSQKQQVFSQNLRNRIFG